MSHSEKSTPGGLTISVERWMAALSGDLPWSELAPYLAPEVTHNIAGRVTQGAEAILHIMQRHAGALAGAVWSVVPDTHSSHVTIRGSTPGRSMTSIGGPISAMDFEFALDELGRISQVIPHPHHLEPPDLLPVLEIGHRITPFELQTLDGASDRIDPKDSAALLVVFTSNHCPWALAWHERLQTVGRDYLARHVRTLQVNANDAGVSPSDSVDRSRERVARGEFSTELFLDDRQRLARSWGARHTPEAFLFNRSGTLVYHGAPDGDFQDRSLEARWLREALDAVLSATSVKRSSSPPVGCTIKWTL